MKKITLFTLILLSAALASGQQKQLEIPLDSSGAAGARVTGIPDSHTRAILVTLVSRRQIRHFRLLTDSTADPLSSFDCDGKKGRYLTAAIRPGGVETCIANKDLSLLRFLYSHDQNTTQTDSLIIPPGQQLFYAFYQDNAFYAVTAQKHSNTLFIYRRRPGAPTETFQKDAGIKKWGIIWWHGTRGFAKNSVDNCYDLLRSVGMTQEDSATAPPMNSVVFKSKCYLRQGMLYLTFDTHRLVTNVIEVPLDERPARILQFNPEGWYHRPLPIGFSTGNSFIFDNTVIIAAIVHRQPWLAFYDLHTARLITSYAPDANGHTSFPRGPIWQEGNFWHKDKVHPIRWDDFAVSAFNFWTMGVTARRLDSGRIEVRIGTIYNRENLGDDLLVFAGFFTPLYIVTEPTLLFSAPPINTMHFTSRFENDGFRALPYKEPNDKSELIANFTNSQILSPKGISGFQIGNDYWLGWYDAALKKYFIYKF